MTVIALALDQDVEHHAVLIDRTPEIVLHALDADEDFVQMPPISRPRPLPAHAVREALAELSAPASDGFVGEEHTAFSEDQLDIAKAEAEYMIQPDGVTDDLGGEAMA